MRHFFFHKIFLVIAFIVSFNFLQKLFIQSQYFSETLAIDGLARSIIADPLGQSQQIYIFLVSIISGTFLLERLIYDPFLYRLTLSTKPSKKAQAIAPIQVVMPRQTNPIGQVSDPKEAKKEAKILEKFEKEHKKFAKDSEQKLKILSSEHEKTVAKIEKSAQSTIAKMQKEIETLRAEVNSQVNTSRKSAIELEKHKKDILSLSDKIYDYFQRLKNQEISALDIKLAPKDTDAEIEILDPEELLEDKKSLSLSDFYPQEAFYPEENEISDEDRSHFLDLILSQDFTSKKDFVTFCADHDIPPLLVAEYGGISM